jgi:6-phosphofructo-2-kinase / fructose-2,6-biphosphatase 4
MLTSIQTLFIESYCDDERLIEENVRNVKISSPDYIGWKPEDAVKDYLHRINSKIPHFETMSREENLNYIKMVNAGESLEINNCRMIGYLLNRIVFYLMNLHIKTHVTYFVRAGECNEEDLYRTDSSLSDAGVAYAQRMTKALLAHRKKEHETFIAQGGNPDALKPLTIWTSTRRRTVETGQHFPESYKRKQRPQLSQLNPGDLEGATIEDIVAKYPEEAIKHKADPYHHRYPRAESYHDLAQRLEPIILEMEREKSDLLIIAHESVLRVLYGYLMASRTEDIPFLEFTRDEIVEIIPASYQNVARRVKISDVVVDSE